MEKIRRVNESTLAESANQTSSSASCAIRQLRGELHNTYKIKLRELGYRLVYEVIDQRLVVVVIAIGKRDHDEAYQIAIKRKSSIYNLA